jgi:hypothetical protein
MPSSAVVDAARRALDTSLDRLEELAPQFVDQA